MVRHNTRPGVGDGINEVHAVSVPEIPVQRFLNPAVHAMNGSANARYNLGSMAMVAGNMDRAIKHYMIAVRSGDADSVEEIKDMYTDGQATKDDYTKALQLYQEYLGEIKSVQRDKAAAAREDYRYY